MQRRIERIAEDWTDLFSGEDAGSGTILLSDPFFLRSCLQIHVPEEILPAESLLEAFAGWSAQCLSALQNQ